MGWLANIEKELGTGRVRKSMRKRRRRSHYYMITYYRNQSDLVGQSVRRETIYEARAAAERARRLGKVKIKIERVKNIRWK